MSGHNEQVTKDADDLDALRAEIAERVAENDRLRHHIKVLEKMLFGRGRETVGTFPPIDAAQGALPFAELQALQAQVDAISKEIEAKEKEARAPKSKGHGRRAEFPKNAPVYQTVIDVPEAERVCKNGHAMTPFDETITRELERLELTVIHEIVRKKYACKTCEEGVCIAAMPPRVLDKSILGPGFLSWILTERFQNHMPYNRLEKKLRAEGCQLSRSTMCETVAKLSDLLEPITQQMHRELVKSRVVHLDDTRVIIQQSQGGGSSTGHVWVYCDHEGRVIFDFTKSRTRDGPLRMLGNYAGYVHADAYSGHDILFVPGGATEVACFAHTRRRFVEAGLTDPLALECVRLIGELYGVERRAREAGIVGDELRDLRQRESKPLLDNLLDWLTVTALKVLPKSPTGQAIGYAKNQWAALCRYIESGDLEIDNNRAERNLRTIAVGRKNWTFVGNETFGEKAAVIYSLVASCREIGVEPRVYLWDVMQRIGAESDVAKLTPHGWKPHFADQATAAWGRFIAKLATATVPVRTI
jgi:transposase